MRSADVREALAKKFCSPEYALFFEVGDATGGRARRWADAITMGLWPSRGLALQGFEIKVSRQDWLNELKQPAKAEAIARYCQYWWLVTPPGLVKDGELPEQWGHYEVHANGLRVAKPAPMNLSPRNISPEFLAALLRRASETDRQLDQAAIAKATERDEERTRDRIKAEVDMRTYSLKDRADTAESKLKAIYDACGLTENEVGALFYDGGFGAAVGMVHRLGIAKTYGGLRDIAGKLKPMADAVERLLPPDLEDAA